MKLKSSPNKRLIINNNLNSFLIKHNRFYTTSAWGNLLWAIVIIMWYLKNYSKTDDKSHSLWMQYSSYKDTVIFEANKRIDRIKIYDVND